MRTADAIRVLLIDDDEDDFVNIRGLLSEIQNIKFHLEWKPSYKEGLQALATGNHDACLLDYRLGQWTGLDLLGESHRRGATCPIILLTGHGDFDLDVKAMQSGAADYLIKGQITPPLLERSIRYAIKNDMDLRDLAEQKESFKTLFNSTFEGILVHKQGLISEANAAVGEIFRCQPEEMAGVPLTRYLRTDFHSELKRQLESGRDLHMEAVGLQKSGAEIYLGLQSRTVNLKGQWVTLVAVRDLTQRKQMEAQILQQDRLASLGLLASSLAHEIGTPLGVIRGRAELLQKSADEKTRATMGLVVTQIDRIAKLVNSLLHLARGHHADAATDVCLGAVLEDVVNLLSHELERKGIALSVSDAGDLTVRAEPGPLGQIFLNLLVNAIHAIEAESKHRPGHQGTIKIEVVQNGHRVEVSVIDNGCGIAEQNMRNLFQPFFTTKDIGLGTGLGLATSYKLAQSWGGAIEVLSKEGQGATFKVILRT